MITVILRALNISILSEIVCTLKQYIGKQSLSRIITQRKTKDKKEKEDAEADVVATAMVNVLATSSVKRKR